MVVTFTQPKRFVAVNGNTSDAAGWLGRPTPVGYAAGWRLRHFSSAEFRPPPGGGRCADDALELAAEVIHVAEPAGLRDAGDRSVLANHKGLRGDQPLADEPAPRAFPQVSSETAAGFAKGSNLARRAISAALHDRRISARTAATTALSGSDASREAGAASERAIKRKNSLTS